MFVVGAVSSAQQTRDQQTLAILNDALNRHKCEGGDINALTSSAPIASVIARLQADTTWAGMTHSFLQKGKTYISRSIYAKGEKHQYRFTKYDTYTAETGGTSPKSLTNGLVGHWKLDAANGATDLSGNGNNGTAQGGLTFGAVADHDGTANGATSFDGVDDYAGIDSSSLLNDLGPLTYSAWVYPRTAGNGSAGKILSKGRPVFGIVTDKWRFSRQCSGNNVRKDSLSGVAYGSWSHVAVTWDGSLNSSSIHIYINGTLEGNGVSQNGGGSLTTDAATPLRIGTLDGSINQFDGIISDVRIYNRALSAEEVLQLYQQ